MLSQNNKVSFHKSYCLNFILILSQSTFKSPKYVYSSLYVFELTVVTYGPVCKTKQTYYVLRELKSFTDKNSFCYADSNGGKEWNIRMNCDYRKSGEIVMQNHKCRISKYIPKQTIAFSLSSSVKCQCLLVILT